MRGFFQDLKGQKFGMLTVLYWAGFKTRKSSRHYFWACRCECGAVRNVYAGHLRNGHTVSCGCPRRQVTYKHLENKVYCTYRSGAKNRNLSFELSKEQFKQFLYSDCYYCGSPPVNKMTYKDKFIMYNGVDRKNNSRGYTLDNVVPCCRRCNLAKKESSLEEFIDMCRQVAALFPRGI